MNCKEGDLAVLVKSDAGNEGAIFRLGRFLGQIPGWTGNDRWETDRPLRAVYIDNGEQAGFGNHARDSHLRPIRDNPGNEDFVTKVRKTLPRKKPITGPVTIDARGEVKA